jgi:hypothetical protein
MSGGARIQAGPPGIRPLPSRLWAAALLLVAAGGLFGLALGGPLTIAHQTETGQGVYASESTVTGWTFLGVSRWVIPSTVPATLSGTAGTPTVLGGASGSYAVNTATAGDPAVSWNFTEAALLPISTEFEFTVKVGTSGLGSTTTLKVYPETQLAHPFVLTFDFFFDLGTGTSTSLPIDTIQITVQQCTSVGTCP